MYTMNIEHQTGGASARFHSCLRAIVRNSRAIFGNQQTLSCEITTVVLLLIKLCFRLGITVSNGAQMADIHCGGRAPQHYLFSRWINCYLDPLKIHALEQVMIYFLESLQYIDISEFSQCWFLYIDQVSCIRRVLRYIHCIPLLLRIIYI